MGEKPITRQARLNEVVAYYALSCAFTRAHEAELRLTKWIREPKNIATTHVCTFGDVHPSPLFAARAIGETGLKWLETLQHEINEAASGNNQLKLF